MSLGQKRSSGGMFTPLNTWWFWLHTCPHRWWCLHTCNYCSKPILTLLSCYVRVFETDATSVSTRPPHTCDTCSHSSPTHTCVFTCQLSICNLWLYLSYIYLWHVILPVNYLPMTCDSTCHLSTCGSTCHMSTGDPWLYLSIIYLCPVTLPVTYLPVVLPVPDPFVKT